MEEDENVEKIIDDNNVQEDLVEEKNIENEIEEVDLVEEEELEKEPDEENKENNTEDNEDDQKQGFEIVTGDGSEIEISPVGEYLNAMRPKTQEEKTKKQIVIPEVKHIENQENEEE